LSPEAITSWTSSRSEEELRAEIVALAKTYLGTPWRHQGRTRQSIDCVGLPIVVGRELGLHSYPDTLRYSRLSTGPELLKPFEEHCNRIRDLSGLLPGDIVIFKDTLFPQHVGIMSSKTNVIHATVHKRRVVEEPLVGDFRRQLLRGYRFKVFGNG
jgi:cell wall-associated NlpC family hydrolase